MPKHLIRRYLPDPEKIARTPGLGFLRHRLEDPNLWHLNRHSVAGAMFWGIWFAFLPIPFQTLPVTVVALIFRVNLPLCILLVWLTNPLTILPCIYLGYWVGAMLLDRPMLTLDGVRQLITHLGDSLFSGEPTTSTGPGFHMSQHVEPFLLGMLVTGFLLGCLGYVGMSWYWRFHVTRAWRRRSLARKRKSG